MCGLERKITRRSTDSNCIPALPARDHQNSTAPSTMAAEPVTLAQVLAAVTDLANRMCGVETRIGGVETRMGIIEAQMSSVWPVCAC